MGSLIQWVAALPQQGIGAWYSLKSLPTQAILRISVKGKDRDLERAKWKQNLRYVCFPQYCTECAVKEVERKWTVVRRAMSSYLLSRIQAAEGSSSCKRAYFLVNNMLQLGWSVCTLFLLPYIFRNVVKFWFSNSSPHYSKAKNTCFCNYDCFITSMSFPGVLQIWVCTEV